MNPPCWPEPARNAALEIEGDMEECIGEVDEEYQGNAVDILTATDVEKWKHKWKPGKTDKPDTPR